MGRGSGFVVAVLVAGLVAGCGDPGRDAAPAGAAVAGATATPAVAAGSPWYDEVAPAAAAVELGPPGSPCPLPLAFSVPAKWKAKPITVTGDLIEVFVQGGAVPRCEIDAKPTGEVGFLRIWTLRDGAFVDPRTALERFADDDSDRSGQAQYRAVTVAGLSAVETTYERRSELTDMVSRVHAVAVSHRDGPVIIALAGMDSDAVQAMLPAYQLAKTSLRHVL